MLPSLSVLLWWLPSLGPEEGPEPASRMLSSVWDPHSIVTFFTLFLDPFGLPRPRFPVDAADAADVETDFCGLDWGGGAATEGRRTGGRSSSSSSSSSGGGGRGCGC